MKRNYFLTTSFLMLALSLVAFSDNLFFDVQQKSNSNPMYVIHGLFCLAWFVILVIQSGLIRSFDYKSHIRLGFAGMLVACGVFISTLYVFVVIYKGYDAMPYYVKANRFFMLSYAGLVLLAYIYRKNSVQHKRYIFIATLFMLGPILDRVAGHLSIENVDVFNLIIWNSFFLSLFVYDWICFKSIHTISVLGFVWFYLVWIVAVLT